MSIGYCSSSRRISLDFEAIGNCGKSRVCRKLFPEDSEVDHMEVMQDLRQILADLQAQYDQRWNFKFREEEALEGRYIWTVMTSLKNDDSTADGQGVRDDKATIEYPDNGLFSNIYIPNGQPNDRAIVKICENNLYSLDRNSYSNQMVSQTHSSTKSGLPANSYCVVQCEPSSRPNTDSDYDTYSESKNVCLTHDDIFFSSSNSFNKLGLGNNTKRSANRSALLQKDQRGKRLGVNRRSSWRRTITRTKNFRKSRSCIASNQRNTIKDYFVAVKKLNRKSSAKKETSKEIK